MFCLLRCSSKVPRKEKLYNIFMFESLFLGFNNEYKGNKMLVVIEVERVEFKIFGDIQNSKEVTVTGKGASLYPDNDYIKELEKKVALYDEYLEESKRQKSEYEKNEKLLKPLREKAKKARKEALEISNTFKCKFLDIKNDQ